MPKSKWRRLAKKAYTVGGWLMVPLFFVAAYAAFVAADERDWFDEGLMIAVMAWSAFEFKWFRRLQAQKSPD
jgi:hypothetical protein